MSYINGYKPAFNKQEYEYECRYKERLIIQVYGRKIKEILGKKAKIINIKSDDDDFKDDLGDDMNIDHDDDNDNHNIKKFQKN